MDPKWLTWAKRLRSISQNGLMYAETPYHIERYEAVRKIALEIISSETGTNIEEINKIFVNETGYATPKVDTRGVVFRDNALLFVKEQDDNSWSLPGGWCEPCEPPSLSIEKEIFEETGFKTKAEKLLGVYDKSKYTPGYWEPFHIYSLYFRCKLIGGKAKTSFETDEVAFFMENEVPGLSFTRVSPELIKRMFQHRAHPDWPTDFD